MSGSYVIIAQELLMEHTSQHLIAAEDKITARNFMGNTRRKQWHEPEGRGPLEYSVKVCQSNRGVHGCSSNPLQ